MAASEKVKFDVSVVVTVHNGAEWLGEALHSILSQSFLGKMELSLFDDASTDDSTKVLDELRAKFAERDIKIVTGSTVQAQPKGVGYGSNRAIRQSSGEFICVLDADDVMRSDRITEQYTVARAHPEAIVGSCFSREPKKSTERYTRWCNSLTPSQLYTQAFTAFGPTVIKPTWFFARGVFDRAGPFCEDGKGVPEDLLFFYKHLSVGGKVMRIDLPLVMYRYHPHCATHSVHRDTIWKLRVKAIQEFVLCKWSQFTIWNAGKQGRRLFRSLAPENQAKVVAFCDVDSKKLSLGHYIHEESKNIPKPRVPIIHYKDAKPPLLLCIKWDLTGGEFERNLDSLGLKEGEDYYHFS
jgi:glycosyltransferase involved in cell wall biosynthesis